MKTKLAIILLHLAANSADAYFTHRNAMPAFNNPQHYQFREYNTVARPFVTRGTGPLVGYFAVASAAELVTASSWTSTIIGNSRLAGKRSPSGVMRLARQ